MGLDRVLLAMETEGVPVPGARTATAFVVAVGPDAAASASELVGTLRDEGIPAISGMEERPMKAQLKLADRAGAQFAVIVGERELADGVLTVRRLEDGHQEVVPRDEIVGWLETAQSAPSVDAVQA
jgi:histidyl-tRNA synthetase